MHRDTKTLILFLISTLLLTSAFFMSCSPLVCRHRSVAAALYLSETYGSKAMVAVGKNSSGELHAQPAVIDSSGKGQ